VSDERLQIDEASLSKRRSSQDLYFQDGWRQGSVFKLPGSAVLSNRLNSTGDAIVTAAALVTNQELFVLVSQDCDIVLDREECVEALVCRLDPTEIERARLRTIIRESAREFVLDWERGLVADAQRRVILDKQCLPFASKHEWEMTEETKRDFSNWLAWRFTRPAVEPEHVSSIQNPIKEAFQKLEKNHAQELAFFVEIVKELRIAYPAPGEKVATMFIILKDDSNFTAEHGTAFDNVCKNLQAAVLNMERFELSIHPEEYSVVLLRAYEATQPFRVDYLTRFGDELVTPTGILRAIRGSTKAASKEDTSEI
jgi:hypothetical protein